MKAVDQILAAIEVAAATLGRPFVVALDGGSGCGKTTIGDAIQRRIEVALVPLDDFYQTTVPEAELPRLPVPKRLEAAFDWGRVRDDALLPLRASRPARWHPFDFMAGLSDEGTYGLLDQVSEVESKSVVILVGAYSASPWLSDLIDLSVLVNVPTRERHRRTAIRDGAAFTSSWHALWDDVEAYYFGQVRPPSWFDLVVANECLTETPTSI